MHIVQSSTTRKTTEDDILKLEKTLHCMLPTEYRQFLFQYNGGRPDDTCFKFISFSGEQEVSKLDAFFSLDEEARIYNVFARLNDYRGRIPDSAFPIGRDVFGNLILMELTGEKRGKIYFWNHEDEDDLAANVSLLAGSFTEFTQLLYSC